MPTLTGIVHIGMGDHARDEARALNTANAGSGGAVSVRQRESEPDVISAGGRRHDLTTAAGRAGFVDTLGVGSVLAQRLVGLLEDAGKNAKDELAQVMVIYAQAERGERNMNRVVLSGHSVGNQIWGDSNGLLNFHLLVDLGQVFPTAAAQVRHLMLSACYSGGERSMQKLREMYPQLDSIWAYTGSSPGTWSGAIPHLQRWERATEDDDGSDVEPRLALGTRKGEFVATWNRQDGYLGGSPLTLSQLQSALTARESLRLEYLSGRRLVADSQSGPLRDYYGLVQRTLSHVDLREADAPRLERLRDQVIRLLYWDVILPKYLAAYEGELRAGYSGISRSFPEWARFSRRDAVVEIPSVKLAASVQSAAAVRRLVTLLDGLFELDSEVVPTNWV